MCTHEEVIRVFKALRLNNPISRTFIPLPDGQFVESSTKLINRKTECVLDIEIRDEFKLSPDDSSSVASIKIKGQQLDKERKLEELNNETEMQEIRVSIDPGDLIFEIDGAEFCPQLPDLEEDDVAILGFERITIRAYFVEYISREDIFIFRLKKPFYDWYYDKFHTGQDSKRECCFQLVYSNLVNARKILATKQVLGSSFLTRCLSPEIIHTEPEQFEPLIPELDELTSENIICYNKKLTKEQRQAVIDILKANNRPHPYILFGPPGTGKTAVLTEFVIQIYKRSPEAKILFVSNANASVDSMARKLLATGQIKDEHIMRFVSSRYMDTDEDFKIIRPRDMVDVEMMPRIVVATCTMSWSLKRDDHFSYEFDFVIVDEAGHAQEPEALIPITLVKNNGSIVLAGDPYQLSPLVLDPQLKDLEESILDRLFKMPLYSKSCSSYNRRYITKLLQCHRSDPRLFRVNNRHFYDGELISSYTSDQNILNILHTTDPMIFDQLKGNQVQSDKSYINYEQATRCVRYAQLLYESNISPDDIGIICGYKAQVGIVLDELKSRIMVPCKVATFDEFQGEERKVIIICTVRSSAGYNSNRGQRGLGFLKDSKRFNVATTRARDVTIVIGDAEVLDLSWDWREYTKNAFNI